jgi:hypothetical protein
MQQPQWPQQMRGMKVQTESKVAQNTSFITALLSEGFGQATAENELLHMQHEAHGGTKHERMGTAR